MHRILNFLQNQVLHAPALFLIFPPLQYIGAILWGDTTERSQGPMCFRTLRQLRHSYVGPLIFFNIIKVSSKRCHIKILCLPYVSFYATCNNWYTSNRLLELLPIHVHRSS
jgi:hypothetical protein